MSMPAPAPSSAAPAAPVPAAPVPATLRDFTPVPVAARSDGWTPEKQRAFIEALADSGSVPAAAHSVGMSMEGAYRLRRRPDAAAFAEAWDAAYGAMTRRLTDAAPSTACKGQALGTGFARAIHGVASPVFHAGERIGERVSYDERLTRFLLERHDPRGHACPEAPALAGSRRGYLHDGDPGWAAKRDTLAPRLARLPRLLARLFRAGGEPAPAPDDAAPAAKGARR